MSKTTRRINEFFRFALRRDVDGVKDKVVFTERQERVFDMFYVKRKSIDFIADTLCVCRMVVNNELKTIRKKIARILEFDE